MATSRIHRGFHRVGVVLAVLALLVAAFIAAQGETTTAVGMVVMAAFLYAAARAVGWVLDGFLSPGPRS